MASRTIQSSSRIPVVSKGQPVASPPITEVFVKDIDNSNIPPANSVSGTKSKNEESDKQGSSQKTMVGQKGFETFLMTGDMIIRTGSPKSNKSTPDHTISANSKIPKKSQIPKLENEGIPDNQKAANSKSQNASSSPKVNSKIPGLVKNKSHSPKLEKAPSSSSSSSAPHQNMAATSSKVSDFGFVHAPVAELEEFSDLSQSSCSEGEACLENGHSSPNSPERLPTKILPNPSSQPHNPPKSQLDEAMETLDKMQSTLPENGNPVFSDSSFSEPPSSGDSGFIHDGQMSDTDTADKNFADNLGTALSQAQREFLSNETLTAKENSCSPALSLASQKDNVICSNSGEKFHMHDGGQHDHHLVRTSKSHENYLQGGNGLALVNIDLDDNLAYSLDTLTYHDSSNSSLDNVNPEAVQVSKSLNNSPEKGTDKLERDFIPGFINLEDIQSKQNNSGTVSDKALDATSTKDSSRGNPAPSGVNSLDNGDSSLCDLDNTNTSGFSGQLGPLTDDSDAESLYHQPSKAVDKPSSVRLAKRLYYLEGFKKSDVSRHLCKKNDFSNLVAEEYLKFFEFEEDTLDMALRKFLTHFSLNGETQERERVLQHFSRRFIECNPGSFNSEDACHTLTCAIMLLNSDLHAPNVGRRMTCQEFIENLAELNDGENFFKEVLRAIYQAIKNEPIEWAVDDCLPDADNVGQDLASSSTPPASPKVLDSNPFLNVPDPSKTTEYKRGYVMRKCCMDSDRRKTPFGKRGWRMMYTVLRDMILYQYKDEHQLKKGSQFVESAHNAIRIHHALATKATDYTKKQHVLRLQTSDWAEYLFQTGDNQELQDWIDTINLVAASLSAPPLPGAVGSRAKFQRPLLPSSYTRLNLREQLYSHETREKELEQELQLHRASAPEKGSKSSVIQDYLEKETYLEFEIKRFKTYVYLLQGKLTSCSELEPSLVETTIGEYEEMGATPSPSVTSSGPTAAGVGNPVQRSLSDRYSYRAAIYHNEHVEYDMM